MRVIHLSTYDIAGGASKAAFRLHTGLRRIGCDSRMLVVFKDSLDPTVDRIEAPTTLPQKLRRFLRRRMIVRELARYSRSIPPSSGLFRTDLSVVGQAPLRQLASADVVHLHWVSGLCDFRALLPAAARSAQLVWTIHDMNPFTGGCHFDGGCGRYADRCGACPQLGSTQTDDLSRVVWRRKRAALDAIPRDRLHLVTPSRWLESAVRASSLFGHLPLRSIPNGLETDVLVPGDRSAARTALGLPQDVPVLLFVANSLSDHRKGLDLLLEAVRPLTASSTVHLASLGRHEGSSQGELGITRLGWVESDRMLAAAYSAADLFVTTPRQDNLPNTVLEAMACGTPIVAFDVGGIPDMVRPRTTGMLVPPGDVEGLRATIVSLLRDENARKNMGEMCRRVAVEEYSIGLQAQRYLELYRQIVPTKAAE